MKQQITKKMKIEEILQKYPEKSEKLSEILFDAGLHCVGCVGASFENLEEGMLLHGMSKKSQEKLIGKLNKALNLQNVTRADERERAIKIPSQRNRADICEQFQSKTKVNITFTDFAAEKCKSFRKKPEHFFKIIPAKNIENFEFKFKEESSKDEISLEDKGIKILINKKDKDKLNGALINYIQGAKKGYFKILKK